MLNERPSSLKGIGYYEGPSLILWIILLIIIWVMAVLFVIRVLKTEDQDPRRGFISFGFFYIFSGLVRIFYFIGWFYPKEYDFYVTLGYIFLICSLLCILYVLEFHVVTQTKKVFFIITVAVLLIDVTETSR